MDKRTHLTRMIHAAGEKAQYDHEVKQIFRNKTILARILKYTTKEFRELPIETVCLGNKDGDNKLLGMLSSLLSQELRTQEKEVILQEYGIATTRLREGMSNMCNLSDLIEERGIEKGIAALVESFKEIGLIRENE